MKIHTCLLQLLLLSALLVLFTGCPGGGPSDPPDPEPPRVTSVAPMGAIGLENDVITFSAAVLGVVTSYQWSFTGVTPLISGDVSPQVTLGVPGSYAGTVQVTGPTGTSEPFDFTFSITPSAPPTWSSRLVQAQTDFATQVRAGLFGDRLIIAYSNLTFGPAGTKDVWIASSSLSRPQSPIDWEVHQLAAGSYGGLGDCELREFQGKPLLHVSASRPTAPSSIFFLAATVAVPSSPVDWVEVSIPYPTGTTTGVKDVREFIPLSNGTIAVAATVSGSGLKRYLLFSGTTLPTANQDWREVPLSSLDSSGDYLIAELDGGISLADVESAHDIPGGAVNGQVSWLHAPTLVPGSAAEFQHVGSEFASGPFPEGRNSLGGFVDLGDRAMLVSTFGTQIAPWRGRHHVIQRQYPLLTPSATLEYDMRMTGPGESEWDPAFFRRSLRWEGRILSSTNFEDDLILIRALTPLPDGPEDFDYHTLLTGRPTNSGTTVEASALVPLADGGVAVLTCARPGDPPQPLEIWYPDGRW